MCAGPLAAAGVVEAALVAEEAPILQPEASGAAQWHDVGRERVQHSRRQCAVEECHLEAPGLLLQVRQVLGDIARGGPRTLEVCGVVVAHWRIDTRAPAAWPVREVPG